MADKNVEIEFDETDREFVEKILTQVLDEMSDSFTLSGMFAPYADIVRICLTDARIHQNEKDKLANGEHERQSLQERWQSE